MTITEGVLIAVVILLVFMIMRSMKARPAAAAGNAAAANAAAAKAAATTGGNARTAVANSPVAILASAAPPSQANSPVSLLASVAPEGYQARINRAPVSPGDSSYEGMAQRGLKENQEYFTTCGGADDVKKALDCVCGDTDQAFAKFDYGAENMDYKDYVASQAVDDKVIENHLQFVRDRKGLGPEATFVTGRVFSPDSHDSYDPIPWVGLNRPQYVQQCNPTQVPDIDTNLYKGRRPYCFWS